MGKALEPESPEKKLSEISLCMGRYFCLPVYRSLCLSPSLSLSHSLPDSLALALSLSRSLALACSLALSSLFAGLFLRRPKTKKMQIGLSEKCEENVKSNRHKHMENIIFQMKNVINTWGNIEIH